MLCVARFWNRYHSRVAQYRRERDLRRGRVVASGDLLEGRVLEQSVPVTDR